MPGCPLLTIETHPDKINFPKKRMLRQFDLTQHFRFYDVYVYSGSTGIWM